MINHVTIEGDSDSHVTEMLTPSTSENKEQSQPVSLTQSPPGLQADSGPSTNRKEVLKEHPISAKCGPQLVLEGWSKYEKGTCNGMQGT